MGIQLSVVLRWSEPVLEDRFFVAPPPPPLKKARGSSDLKALVLPLLFLFGCRGGGEEEDRLSVAALFRVVEVVRSLSSILVVFRMRLWRSPVHASSSLHPLVEWRPIGVVVFFGCHGGGREHSLQQATGVCSGKPPPPPGGGVA